MSKSNRGSQANAAALRVRVPLPRRDDHEGWRALEAAARRVALRVVRGGCADDVRERTQAALLALLEAEAAGRLDPRRPGQAYLAQIVRNQAMNARRDDGERARVRGTDPDAIVVRTRALPTDAERARAARTALASLGEVDLEYLEAFYLDRIGQRELAVRMGKTPAAANMWLFRMRKRVQDGLANAG